MLKEARESYSAKYETPFTAWLYAQSLSGCDEETGSVDELGAWFGLMGRYVIVEDSSGAVWLHRLDKSDRGSAEAFYNWVAGWVGEESWSAYMGADDGPQDADPEPELCPTHNAPHAPGSLACELRMAEAQIN